MLLRRASNPVAEGSFPPSHLKSPWSFNSRSGKRQRSKRAQQAVSAVGQSAGVWGGGVAKSHCLPSIPSSSPISWLGQSMRRPRTSSPSSALPTDSEQPTQSTQLSMTKQSLGARLMSMKIMGLDPSPELVAISMVYFVQGILGLSRLALSFFFKDTLHIEPAEVAILTGFAGIPWMIKPLYGFISDSIPLFGYRRRSYLVLAGLVGTTAWTLLATSVGDARGAAACMLLGSLSTAASDVLVDSIVVERARGAPQGAAGSLQSLCWGSAAMGGILSAYFSGSLVEEYGTRFVFSITALFPLIVSCSALLINEKRILPGSTLPSGSTDINDSTAHLNSSSSTTPMLHMSELRSRGKEQSSSQEEEEAVPLLSSHLEKEGGRGNGGGNRQRIQTGLAGGGGHEEVQLGALSGLKKNEIGDQVRGHSVVVVAPSHPHPHSQNGSQPQSTSSTQPTTTNHNQPLYTLQPHHVHSVLTHQPGLPFDPPDIGSELNGKRPSLRSSSGRLSENFRDGELNGTVVLPGSSGVPHSRQSLGAQALSKGRALWAAVSQPAILLPTVFVFLYQATPSAESAMFYFQTSELNFQPEFLGRVRLVGALASLAGVMLYNGALKKVPLRNLLWWSMIIGTVLGSTQLLLISRLNLAIGLSDQLFVLGDSVILTVLAQASFMPILVLAARLCPEGVEATLFATLMSILNCGSFVGSGLGAALTKALGVTSDNFDNLFTLVLICNLATMAPAPFLYLLPSSLDHGNEDEDGEAPPGTADGGALKKEEHAN